MEATAQLHTSALALFVARIFANDPDRAVPPNGLAVAADLFDRCSNFHGSLRLSVAWHGDSQAADATASKSTKPFSDLYRVKPAPGAFKFAFFINPSY